MSLPHLNSDDIYKLRNLVTEAVRQKQEIDDLTAAMNDTIKHVSQELDIPIKVIKDAIKIEYKDNLAEVKDQTTATEELIEVIRNKNISST